MNETKLFRTVVWWTDGSFSTYSIHGTDKGDAENQLLDTLHNVRDSIESYYFKELKESQYGKKQA